MLDGLQLDPYEILGVPREASLEEIREAYHAKSKKYHPDAGGDEWVFRIVARAYHALAARAPSGRSATGSPTPARAKAAESSRIRPGVQDRGIDPARLVAVEVVWRRYEVGDFLELLSEAPSQRNLGGGLQMTWPDPASPVSVLPAEQTERIHRALNAAFDDLRGRTPVQTAQSRIDDGRFEARILYPNGPVAADAFKRLHVSLRARGLGVRQWTRDVTVPRETVG